MQLRALQARGLAARRTLRTLGATPSLGTSRGTRTRRRESQSRSSIRRRRQTLRGGRPRVTSTHRSVQPTRRGKPSLCTGASTFAPTPFRRRASTPTPRVPLAAGATASVRKRSRPCAPALFPAATTPASMRPRRRRRGRRARTPLRCARWGWQHQCMRVDAASMATACVRARLRAKRTATAARPRRARTPASTPASASSPATTITTTAATCLQNVQPTERGAKRAARGRSFPTLT